jgi:hypothetical protein
LREACEKRVTQFASGFLQSQTATAHQLRCAPLATEEFKTVVAG